MKEMYDYIEAHREEAVAFLQKLLSFDTTFIDQGVRGNEGEAQKWLAKQLKEWGFQTSLTEPDNQKMESWPDFNFGHDYQDRPNLVGILKGNGEGKSLLFNGHMDTVPLDDLEKWKYHPLAGRIEDGKLYGRGACDMKAGLAAMILAAKYRKDMGLPQGGDIVIESVVDEEGGGNGTLALVADGITADAAIVTEPTNLDIYCASRGVFLLEVEVNGKPSHACYKWSGVNAIEKGIKIASALKELETRWLALRCNPYLPSPTITLGQIEGGISAATVPGTCKLRFDIKYLPYEIDRDGNRNDIDSKDIQKEVEDCIQSVCDGDPWLKEHPVKLNWYLTVMPHTIDMDNPILKVTEEACLEVSGHSHISGLPSGADARHLQNNGHIPTILFGPGDMRNAHSINEYVCVDDYITAIKVLAGVISRWTNSKEES